MDVLSGFCARPNRGHSTAVPAARGAAVGRSGKTVPGSHPRGCGEASPKAACGGTGRVCPAGPGCGGALPRGVVSGSRVDGLEPVDVADGTAPLPAGDQGSLSRGGRAAALGRLAGDSASRSPGAARPGAAGRRLRGGAAGLGDWTSGSGGGG